MLKLFDRQEFAADIDLVDGELRVNSVTGSWVSRLMEEMRGEMTDTELFESLPERLRGHIWVGEVLEGKEKPVKPLADDESGAG